MTRIANKGTTQRPHVRCYTRAIKNARYLQSVAPDLFHKGREAEGFGTGIPLEILRVLHRTRHDSPLLNRHKELADFLKGHPIPVPKRTARAALFNGTLHFAQVTFNTGSGNLVVPTADMNTIVQYAQHAAVPINEYAKQYGPNSIKVSPTLITSTVNVGGTSFSDSDLDGWVNTIATANGLGASDCVFIVFPSGLTGTGTNTSAIGDNSGFHFKANISYVAAGVYHTGLTLQDVADVYAMVVSHEAAEMVVDPNGDLSNPEVCDPCDINCNNLTRIYFDSSDNFLGVNQNSPPSGFPFAYYICSIVKPGGASTCPAAASDCQYAPIPPNLQFIIEKGTFSVDEVKGNLPAKFQSAYWLAVDGFDASELGFNSTGDLNNLPPSSNPSITATVDPALNTGLTATQISNISASLPTFNQPGPAPILAQDPSLNNPLQRFLFPYTVQFNDVNAFASLQADQSVVITLHGTFTVGSSTLNASVNVELTAGENPYFENLNPLNPTQFPTWLSFDLRFFKVTAGGSKFGTSAALNAAPDAPGFIADILSRLNTAGTDLKGDSFEGLDQDEDKSAVEFLQKDDNGNLTFNFALARVRLKGSTAGAQAKATRVFFRLFQAQTTSSEFNDQTTYRFASDGVLNGHKIARLGVQNSEYVTIPCFASPRVNVDPNTNQPVLVSMDTQNDPPNVRDINVIPGVEVDTYFGCWLDVNQPQQTFLPSSPPAGNLDGGWTGVFSSSNPPQSINQVISKSPHQCLIAEIRYDDTPIPPGANSSTSDKLAQRNIAWIDGPNPGVDISRRMPHPIEIRTTPTVADTPDELMISWGNTPKGSTGSLYLPGVSAADILSLANSMYPWHQLTAAEANTIQVPAYGTAFVPIPAGTVRLAGLLTVDLPLGITKGDIYEIFVRQLTEGLYVPPPPIERTAVVRALPAGAYSWRNAFGAFKFSIVIKTKQQILFREERLLAWLRWIQLTIPAANRWYPVLHRYIDQIAGRVQGFGGNPNTIPPSSTGEVPGHPMPHPHPHPHPKPCEPEKEKRLEFTGKVVGLFHDRFGDFEGFLLMTECGEERAFRVHEHQIAEMITKAWEQRAVISVYVDRDRPHWPATILVRRAPEPFQH